jgi:hypothetical protein
MYETLTEFERALARFGDKVGLIAGLEIADKITPEEAYQQIKCGQEKPLNKDHYQVVKAFKSGFSYYCNDCSVEMKKTKPTNK